MIKISGVYTDPDGVPVPGVTIIFVLMGNTANSFIRRSARMTTDISGRYSITLSPGRYLVNASHNAFGRCTNTEDNPLGIIEISCESTDGTLNDFLLASAPQINPVIERMQELYFATLALSKNLVSVVNKQEDIPADMAGLIIVVEDEIKNAPALYLYSGGKRYWLAMVEDTDE